MHEHIHNYIYYSKPMMCDLGVLILAICPYLIGTDLEARVMYSITRGQLYLYQE